VAINSTNEANKAASTCLSSLYYLDVYEGYGRQHRHGEENTYAQTYMNVCVCVWVGVWVWVCGYGCVGVGL
jgi:hypothetical protein